MRPHPPLAETFERILRERLPNLFRLYVNPFVAQACLCLARYAGTTWRRPPGTEDDFQTFLANGFDEALGGAIKLARYAASVTGGPTTGLVIDGADRLGPFASAPIAGGGRVTFVPGLEVVGKDDAFPPVPPTGPPFGFVVLVPGADGGLGRHTEAARALVRSDYALVVTCVDRESLAALRRSADAALREPAPDVVVFDETFVNRDVPFAAFTARKELYDHWNRPGKTTFHSTTYQPNTISALHFLRCLEAADPDFHAALAADLRRVEADPGFRAALFRRMYSPSLARATRAAGLDGADVRASGSFVHAGGRRIFDGVSGVACSARGHNPPTYAAEMAALGAPEDCERELAERLRDLTGLGALLPAVSGATAVENGLKIALAAQYPKRTVLALKAGFGGKTLLSLTATWSASYKVNVGPLYPDVVYVDPFAPDATAQIDAALAAFPVAVVQAELIQGVGGVRRVPEAVVRHLAEGRERWGYLLLIDEVQTGMYRTGPLALSPALGLRPDLLVLGKAASDMMFPVALLLYSDAVREKVERASPGLSADLRRRYGYEYGYKTVLNVLRQAEKMGLSQRVTESGALFARLLGAALSGCRTVREVRAHGLLIGVELDVSRWPRRWFRKGLFWLCLLAMLRHPRRPVLVGFCQAEPNVLKITPPLTTSPEEMREACATIAEVLRRPFYRLLMTGLGGLLRSLGLWRRKHEHAGDAAPEPVAR
jgi:acetylornithine/succinyldiaminopimelate/putrescine aminotransferase